jgi:hypothetical protein
MSSNALTASPKELNIFGYDEPISNPKKTTTRQFLSGASGALPTDDINSEFSVNTLLPYATALIPTKYQKKVLWGMLGIKLGINLYNFIKKKQENRKCTTLHITSLDDLYQYVQGYVATIDNIQHEGREFKPFLYDGKVGLMPCGRINLKIFDTDVVLEEEVGGGGGQTREQNRPMDRMVFGMYNLTIYSQDDTLIEEILTELIQKGGMSEEVPPLTRVYGCKWGSWRVMRDIHIQRNVFLPDSLYNDLLIDAQTFAASHRRYEELGIPYRRGYLFHGIPGSGKTSTIVSIAAALKKNVYILSLAGVDDEDLMDLFRSIPGKSILVIEDIDHFKIQSASIDEPGASSSEKKTINLSSLLNMLDGILAVEDVMLFVTTNNIGAIDPSLIRPGRIDVKVQFREATTEQIIRMMNLFEMDSQWILDHADVWACEKISMAEVQNRLVSIVFKNKTF